MKDKFYVGACTVSLHTEFKRIRERYYENNKRCGVYQMFVNDDAYIVLYEAFRCDNIHEYIIRLHDVRIMLNKYPPKPNYKLETTLKKIRRLIAIEEDRLENDNVTFFYDKMIFKSVCDSIDVIINNRND